jgi:hypothetical protein
MDNAKLISYINSHSWWRTALPGEKAVNARGLFYASSFKDAEFYGRPIDTPFRVKVTNPLFSDEPLIMQFLGLSLQSPGISIKERFALDAKMMELAALKGYDSIALTTTKAYEKYIVTSRIPRSIELQVFSGAR